ncbi:MAG TPA: SAM-dependent methyltransferase [Cyanobacteria bacterium UBA11149]|nr:SAM-dependent methyltransferase [Cyanobacteria bacterium UBA11367]HBE56340.1 SAM-dependent methyltransferase [Cyanobacteria bacterium UBA11366]HBK65946.1 SAM-dependent methyltransferase [Cyanobacteria bacterium UBA11166]HBR76257.1 SAM-dependent methyltransferase [Cyanobacteria bacterium UBA11159]HBS70492.1 SAM-dependent methyltransferase [Cyanobacteria bacterium UBA11153]HBW91848.1 SAM-dependent methyltransferase [Cyanobacteria bacterium UBA11149]HCA94778.1 SAM-dependent methyltransferase 
MTTTINTTNTLTSRLVNGLLAIKPLADFAKHQARTMMIKRAEEIGVPWTKKVEEFRTINWETYLNQVQNRELTYPDYYVCSFHAYEKGNLSWEAAWEVESAAYAVHAKIWPDAGAKGDPKLRQSYHDIIKKQITIQPQDILDLGCSVGMSTIALQETYPQAQITGIDLSPYFLAVAQYNSEQNHHHITWKHSTAEATGLPDKSFDIVSSFLMFHELPQKPTTEIIKEAKRLLRPGGYLTIMDMNPQSEIYAQMPPYILTLLKSTEPYLDEYFTLDIEKTIIEAGFHQPTITPNSPRHRTIIAQAK